MQRGGHERCGRGRVGAPGLPALSEDTRARAQLRGRREERRREWTATETAEPRGLPPELGWANVKRGDVKQRDGGERRKSERERDGRRGGGSVLLELYVVRWAHLHFSLAYVFPVGAQDCTT